MLELNHEKRIRSKQLFETLLKHEQQILDLEPFYPANVTNPGYNVHTPNGFYNQPYQPYSNQPATYAQVPQGYSYPSVANGGVANMSGNPQYVSNVRWN